MKNKTLNNLMASHGDKIATWYKDTDGYWVTLKWGWQASPHSEVHTLHESSVAEIKKSFRYVCACDCLQCRTDGKQWVDYDVA
jgi:hypothetical protein